jgi:hypothetical protein
MLQNDELFSLDESEDTLELLRALPEIRHNLSTAAKDELGLRSLLDWADSDPPRITPEAA